MEKELKFLIPDKDIFKKLEEILSQFPVQVEDQENLYFAPIGKNPFNFAENTSLRVRKSNENYSITCKLKVSKKNAYYIANELEENLNKNEAMKILTSPEELNKSDSRIFKKFLNETGVDNVQFAGKTKNIRKNFLVEGAVFSLDTTWFSDNTIDYELEVETDYPDDVIQLMSCLFGRLFYILEPQDKTKQQRCLERTKVLRHKDAKKTIKEDIN